MSRRFCQSCPGSPQIPPVPYDRSVSRSSTSPLPPEDPLYRSPPILGAQSCAAQPGLLSLQLAREARNSAPTHRLIFPPSRRSPPAPPPALSPRLPPTLPSAPTPGPSRRRRPSLQPQPAVARRPCPAPPAGPGRLSKVGTPPGQPGFCARPCSGADTRPQNLSPALLGTTEQVYQRLEPVIDVS